MLSLLYKGFIIGILVSAPMGPIGLLCIQRTLNKGRWHGFATGLGAVGSDLIYALFTCLGLGIVIDFIQGNQEVLQIIGGFLLIAFGIYTYRSNPSKSLQKPKESVSYHQDVLTAFGLALSNPFIIFLYVALFARFNFLEGNHTFSIVFTIAFGLLCVALGAVFWWFVITYLVDKVRSSFNLRGLWIMNRVIGTVIIILSIVGIAYAVVDYMDKFNV